MSIYLPKSLEPYRSRIAAWSDERDSSNLIFIDYRAGWRSSTDPVGIVHLDSAGTVKEALALVRAAERCDCTECRAETENPNRAPGT